MLAVKVCMPDKYNIDPIPLKSEVWRENLLSGTRLFSMVQFPYAKYNRMPPLEIAIGQKYPMDEPDNQALGSIFSQNIRIPKLC